MRGSSNSNRKMKKEKGRGEEEVEELLQAAQDQILLNLSLNSHIARAPPTPSSIGDHDRNSDDVGIHLDLERRFQALRTKSPATATQQQQHNNDQELRSVLGNDLSARFAALKAKSSSSSSSSTSTVGLGLTGTGGAAASSALYDEESEDEEEQVQKLIDWAKDAARLDPSPPSDDEEEQEDVDHHDEDSSASDQDINHTPRKRK